MIDADPSPTDHDADDVADSFAAASRTDPTATTAAVPCPLHRGHVDWERGGTRGDRRDTRNVALRSRRLRRFGRRLGDLHFRLRFRRRRMRLVLLEIGRSCRHATRGRGLLHRRCAVRLLDLRHETRRLIRARGTGELRTRRGRRLEVLPQVVSDRGRVGRTPAARHRDERDRNELSYEVGSHHSPDSGTVQRPALSRLRHPLQCTDQAMCSTRVFTGSTRPKVLPSVLFR